MIAIIAEMVAVEIMQIAKDTAPIYIAVKQAKKTAKNPPAAANDISNETMTAFSVATNKKIIKLSNPVNARRLIVPTEMTNRARRGPPRRVQRRRSRTEILEASRRRGAALAAEDLSR